MNTKLINYLLSEDTLLFEGGVLNRFVNYAKSTAYFPRNYVANMKVLFKYGKVTADDMIDFMNKQFEYPFSVTLVNKMIQGIEELKKDKVKLNKNMETDRKFFKDEKELQKYYKWYLNEFPKLIRKRADDLDK